MSTSSDDGEENWISYVDRPEWKDVVPLPQDDGTPPDEPVVAISYSEKFKDVYNYFRAVLKANELSERSLRLTADAIKLNPANYTVWEYRRKILKHLNKDLREELNFTAEAIEDNQKNYQVWHHRLVIVQWLNDPKGELEFIAEMLKCDSKNYHAWQYRQWLIRTFKQYEGELDYINQLLEEDIRNNSAWNQRYFLIKETTGFTPDIVDREIDFCVQSILKVKKNESAWNYLRGILNHSKDGLLEPKAFGFAEELYKRDCRSPYLLAYLVDALTLTLRNDFKHEDLQRIFSLCQELAEKHDIIRKRYWTYVEENIKSKFHEKQLEKEVQ